jgi:hypothetical protein
MDKAISLSDFANEIVGRLPQVPCSCNARRTPDAPRVEEKHFEFTAETFPEIPSVLTTRDLVMKRTEHGYGNCIRVDMIHFYASGHTYRQLAVLLLAGVFAEAHKQVALELKHEDSTIKRLEVHQSKRGFIWGYVKRPVQFRYHPEIPAQNPWRNFDEYHRPEFDLGFRKGTASNPVSELDKRDQAHINGNDDALVLLSELLLNIGLPDCDIPVGHDPSVDKTYKLKSGLASGGVGRWSAEAYFSLPNSFSWPGEYPELG